MSPTLLADSLPSGPPGKPKNMVVGTLSLLQGIFLTQELNWSLLHYRQNLYQLSYWDLNSSTDPLKAPTQSPTEKGGLGSCHPSS